MWLEQPLLDINTIVRRQDAISTLLDNFILRQNLIEQFTGIYDLERLCGRIALGQINARDLVSLISVLEKIGPIKDILNDFDDPYINSLNKQLQDLPDLMVLLNTAIVDEPPISIKEGNLIRTGFNSEVDNYRDATQNGKQWILNLETQERERTGIKSLKIGYNRVFGYYIDVRKTNLDAVPQEYIRRQTSTNSERYITEELKSWKIKFSEQKFL